MSTPTANLAERFNEIAALAAAEQVVRILREYAMEPSSKRWARSRNAAIERWAQLAQIAEQRACNNVATPPGKPAAKAKPRPSRAAPKAADAPLFEVPVLHESTPATATGA